MNWNPLLNLVSNKKKAVLRPEKDLISLENATPHFDVEPCDLHKYKEKLDEQNLHYEKVSAKRLQVTFELINILVRRKYVEAPDVFHIEYGLCTTFIFGIV